MIAFRLCHMAFVYINNKVRLWFVTLTASTIVRLIKLGDFFFFKQKTAYELRISDWSSDGALPISAVAQQRVDEGHDILRPRAVREAGAEQAVLHALGRRHRLALAVEESAAAAPGRVEFVDVGIVDDADLDLAIHHQRDRYAPGRHAAEEAGGAVDRIDHPDRLAGRAALAGAGLLAEKAVLRAARLQFAADQLLDLLVGDGDDVLQPLALDRQLGAALIIIVGEATGLARQLLDESIALLQSVSVKHRESRSPGGFGDPVVRRIVLEAPLALRTGHDVQIVEVVAVRRTDGMIAARHHHAIAEIGRAHV